MNDGKSHHQHFELLADADVTMSTRGRVCRLHLLQTQKPSSLSTKTETNVTKQVKFEVNTDDKAAHSEFDPISAQLY